MISITSSWQQQAAQVEHVTAGSSPWISASGMSVAFRAVLPSVWRRGLPAIAAGEIQILLQHVDIDGQL
ncbi:hypothetical protein, partial [Pseudomonas syringae]|uniref:hypothetical protein n=1 Tax=Pseudomonas syringae TaxID=317 RepID=UPI001EFE6D0B